LVCSTTIARTIEGSMPARTGANVSAVDIEFPNR
jgi:hypothetical protein